MMTMTGNNITSYQFLYLNGYYYVRFCAAGLEKMIKAVLLIILDVLCSFVSGEIIDYKICSNYKTLCIRRLNSSQWA